MSGLRHPLMVRTTGTHSLAHYVARSGKDGASQVIQDRHAPPVPGTAQQCRCKPVILAEAEKEAPT